MQSVFKLPLALTALHLVEQGRFPLDQPIHFLLGDRILPETYSPLQDKYPDADVEVPLQELLRLSTSLSDNVAADILLQVVGGPTAVNSYMASIGVIGFHLQDNEHILQRDPTAQYRNWFEPAGAVQIAPPDQRSFAAHTRTHQTSSEMDAEIRPTARARSRAICPRKPL